MENAKWSLDKSHRQSQIVQTNMKTRLIESIVIALLLSILVTFLYRLATTKAVVSPCEVNLHRIQSVKFVWMQDCGKASNERPTWQDLAEFWRYEGLTNRPFCPNGGTYTLGAVMEHPKCSIRWNGHSY